MSRGPLPNDVHEGSEEGLHLIAEAVLGTQCLDQRCHPMVAVPGHGGEEAGGRGEHVMAPEVGR